MKEHEWSCVWGTERIVVQVQSDIGFRRRILVNDVIVVEEDVANPRDAGYLCARTTLAGSTRIVEAAFGPRFTRPACKIYVNERPIGGDLELRFSVPEPPLWPAIRERGRARFVFERAIRVAIPGMLVAMVLLALGFPEVGIGAFAATVVTSWSSADRFWTLAERQYLYRKKRLEDPSFAPGRQPGEFPSPSRFLSLFLRTLGVFLIALSSLVLLIAMMATPKTARDDVLLLIPVATLAVGIALVRWARLVAKRTKAQTRSK